MNNLHSFSGSKLLNSLLDKVLGHVKFRGIEVSPIGILEAANHKNNNFLVKKGKKQKIERNWSMYTSSVAIASERELQTFENVVLIKERKKSNEKNTVTPTHTNKEKYYT